MKALEKAEGRGSNPYYAGNFDGESDELRDLRLSLVAERDALKADLERIKALPPVAEVRLNKTGGNAGLSTHIVQLAEGYFPAGTKLYALGSKT